MCNIWGENQSSTGLSFCFLISCSRVKTKCARKSRTLHPQRVSSRRMTTAFSGLQTMVSLYNVWGNHQSPLDLSFCLLTSCPRVKPCKGESTALHSPKRIQVIRLQSLLGDPNKAVYVNKRAAKRQHNRSTNEKKKNNNNNNNSRDSATNATRSLQRESCNRLSD